MLTIIKNKDQLFVEYTANSFNNLKWIDEQLRIQHSVTLRRTFTFKTSALVNEVSPDEASEESRTFVLANAFGDYYTIDRNILGIKHDLKI
jgi:hypothetical protein